MARQEKKRRLKIKDPPFGLGQIQKREKENREKLREKLLRDRRRSKKGGSLEIFEVLELVSC